eukprot:3916813-Prymnesium_polylepis.1
MGASFLQWAHHLCAVVAGDARRAQERPVEHKRPGAGWLAERGARRVKLDEPEAIARLLVILDVELHNLGQRAGERSGEQHHAQKRHERHILFLRHVT